MHAVDNLLALNIMSGNIKPIAVMDGGIYTAYAFRHADLQRRVY